MTKITAPTRSTLDGRTATTPNTPTILMVDDDPSLLRKYALALEEVGYRVLAAFDGRSALARIREEHPDLVVLAFALPDLDGIAVLESLRADPTTSSLPVVVLTSYPERPLVDRARALGSLDCLVKNAVGPAELVEKLGSWFAQIGPSGLRGIRNGPGDSGRPESLSA